MTTFVKATNNFRLCMLLVFVNILRNFYTNLFKLNIFVSHSLYDYEFLFGFATQNPISINAGPRLRKHQNVREA